MWDLPALNSQPSEVTHHAAYRFFSGPAGKMMAQFGFQDAGKAYLRRLVAAIGGMTDGLHHAELHEDFLVMPEGAQGWNGRVVMLQRATQRVG